MGLLVLVSVVCGIIGALIGRAKNREGEGVALGCLLGPIGLLVGLLMKDKSTRCPACKEKIQAGASICPHCRQPQSPAFEMTGKKLL